MAVLLSLLLSYLSLSRAIPTERRSTVVEASSKVTNTTFGLVDSLGKGIQKEISAVKQPIEETLVYIGSSQCSHVKKILGVAYEQIEGEKEPDLNQLTLEYSDRSVRVIYNITAAAHDITEARAFDPQRKLFIFVHGFTDDPTQSGFRNISEALMASGEYQVLALDGSSLIYWLYLRATTYVRFMGEKLGETLAAMVSRGVNPANIHIIGHSLGAHISGFTGKTFANLTGKRIGRISGLDPAGPCFSHVDPELRLKSTDAEFVDVIHTDGGVYGLKDPIGGVNPANIHIIGHSLGAHISGFTGKTFANLTGKRIGRISGLDPAGPCFSHVDPELRLKSTDAEFVDVIHTDGGVYGLKDPIGHVDFYPNSGSEQPSCFYQTCSHSRAWLYYAESVVSTDAFPARRCASWEDFKKGRCEASISYMGYGCRPGARGQYYLQTGPEQPFGLGRRGLAFHNNDGIIKNIASSIFGR